MKLPWATDARGSARELGATYGRLLIPALALLAASCQVTGDLGSPDLGPAIALDAESPTPSAEELALLQRQGVAQFWIEWGSIEPDADRLRVLRAPTESAPRGAGVVLVLRGEWTTLRTASEDALDGLSRQLVSTAAEAEAAGSLVRGVLLALESSQVAQEDDTIVARLRAGLDGRRSLGVDLARAWLMGGDAEALRAVASEADFLSSQLYGGSAAETALWDLEALRAAVGVLENLGRPYLVGVSIVGSLKANAGGGEAARSLPREVLYARRMVVEPGFAFEGYVRQLLEIQFLARTDLGGVTARPGESWTLSRPTAGHLDQVLRALRETAGPAYRGPVLGALRSSDEALAISLDEVLGALAGSPASLPLDLSFSVERREGGMAGVVGLANPGATTAAAAVDHNLVEVNIEGGSFGRIEPGRFARYELLDAFGQRASLRQARRLRLYFRFLERGEQIESGAIEWIGDSRTRVAVEARHLSATGEVLAAAPAFWPKPPEARE